MSVCSWNQVQVKISKLQDQNLKVTNSASLMKNHGWISSLSPNTPSVNQLFLTSSNSPIWSKRTNLVGFNISKRMILKIIQFQIWQKEWVNKSKKWEHLWKCAWSDQSEKTEHWLLAQSSSPQLLDNNMLILSLILCKIFGLNQSIMFQSYSCCHQVLTLPAQLMSLPERKRNSPKKCQWVKDSRNLPEKLLSQEWSQETG